MTVELNIYHIVKHMKNNQYLRIKGLKIIK